MKIINQLNEDMEILKSIEFENLDEIQEKLDEIEYCLSKVIDSLEE